MKNWDFVAEFIAFIIIVIVWLYFYDRHQIASKKRRLFQLSLAFGASSIIINTICVYAMADFASYPLAFHMFINMLYYFISVWMCTSIAYYLMELLSEHVHEEGIIRLVSAIFVIANAAFAAIMINNLFFKNVFYFDANGVYCRGPIYWIGYLTMMLELVVVVWFVIAYQEYITKRVKRVFMTLPPIVILLLVYQLTYPDVLMNGSIFAFAILIIYINFQSYQVEKDMLTHLGNRNTFYNDLNYLLKKKKDIQIVQITINNLKQINQKFGQYVGDDFLYQMANWIEDYDKNSYAYRLGNVTYAVIFVKKGDSLSRLQGIANRFKEYWIVGNVRANMNTQLQNMIVTSGMTAEDIVESLDTMSMIAKQEGVEILEYGEYIKFKIARRRYVEEYLIKAIQENLFQIYLQPLYNCNLRAYTACEALLRLDDENGNPIRPDEFVPIAEENGLIDDISWIVLDRVCAFLATHSDSTIASISINLSMQQFLDEKLYDRIKNALEEYDLLPSKLKIEITERVIADDMLLAKDLIRKISALGIGFYIDDFGTGYSNFSSLLDFPIECVKIDRSLIKDIKTNGKNKHLVTNLISMFHGVGFKVVCEGIEDEEEAAIICDSGADYIQGFYYSKPRPKSEIIPYFK